ncbi:MAG TPA: hypothetical protein VKT49_19810 [Bryobacteraceae bacterium]|nr:hypothetical protein [Bryobacteraceae bacterium]
MRTIVNTLADGRSVRLADPAGEIMEWHLQYADLSDEEACALKQFFEATEGSLRVFTFLDPTGNLFAWSDHLDYAGWIKGPLLSVTGGVADPTGGAKGWRLSNAGAAGQSLSQILAVPSGYIYCLSAYARSSAPGATVSSLRGSARCEHVLTSEWKRLRFSGTGANRSDAIEFGFEVPAGGSLDVYGMQVEPQTGASTYKPSTTGGVFANAWFRDNSLSLTATDVNRHFATVSIIHGNRL